MPSTYYYENESGEDHDKHRDKDCSQGYIWNIPKVEIMKGKSEDQPYQHSKVSISENTINIIYEMRLGMSW